MPAPPPPGPTPPPSSRFAPYRQALQALSARTGTALPSLVVSFAVLHELTAVVPVAGFFFAARALGVGERVVQAVAAADTGADADGPRAWAAAKGRQWVDEGGRWAQRVGRRYGVFGYEKRDGSVGVGDEEAGRGSAEDGGVSARLAGDAANAILAYGLTKAGCSTKTGIV